MPTILALRLGTQGPHLPAAHKLTLGPHRLHQMHAMHAPLAQRAWASPATAASHGRTHRGGGAGGKAPLGGACGATLRGPAQP